MEEPGYTEVNPGGNAELRCLIDNIGGECRWQKDGKVRKKSEPGKSNRTGNYTIQ